LVPKMVNRPDSNSSSRFKKNSNYGLIKQALDCEENANPNIVGHDRLPSRGGMKQGKLRLNNAFDITKVRNPPRTAFNSTGIKSEDDLN